MRGSGCDEELHGVALESIGNPRACLIAAQVVTWCNYHSEGMDEDDVIDRDEDFMKELNQKEIFEIMLAANFLDIDALVELAARTLAMKVRLSGARVSESAVALFNVAPWAGEEILVTVCAPQIKGKTTEELRQNFGIQNDWTKEEEDIIYGRRDPAMPTPQ